MDEKPVELSPSLQERWENREETEAKLKDAIVNAMRVHKFFRVPWVVWRDGKVVEIPPEEIPVNEADFDEPPKMPNW